ncbi:MAG: DUF871 family protein [Erysipelotrichaceae bacterium]|nr:DUF871 family protein [Erysipelotrichaceae bacterium]
MSTIGISLYLDYCDLETCMKKIDRAAELGYSECFTSFNFAEYRFPGERKDTDENRKKLIGYANSRGLRFHIDITRNLLYSMGGSISDLSCFKELGIPVIRLDGGFEPEEVAELTRNGSGILIEDNLSNYVLMKKTLPIVKEKGDLSQYLACLNFFPRNYTGLKMEEAAEMARELKACGGMVGGFIGSLYSPTQMNDTSTGTPSIEEHRFLPASVQMSEMLLNGFDYVLFGDSDPSDEELEAAASAHRCFEEGYVEIPCYFDDIDPEILEKIRSTDFLSRIDHAEKVIRGTQSRGIDMKLYNTISRNRYCITLDNILSNQYRGELQICLEELPAERFVNVIGQVRPYAVRLLKYIHQEPVHFRLV